MFTQLIFIILLLLLTSFTTTNTNPLLFYSYTLGYFFLLGYNIYKSHTWKKNRANRKEKLSFSLSLQLVLYISILCIFIGFPRVSPFRTTFLVSFIFGLYFFGIFIFNYFYPSKKRSISKALNNIFIIIPFALPLLAYTLINDVFLWGGYILDEQPYYILALFGVSFILLLLMLMPPVLLFFWRCKPLTDEPLVQDLQKVCTLANFKHGGLKIWTVLNHTPTAAIIGILPKFRYVMFTRSIINTLSISALQAVLAHEIGHSKKKHLLKLPFILLGMGVLASVLLLFVNEGIGSWIQSMEKRSPGAFWYEIEVAILFAVTALSAAFYIRYVFGYFSRMYEKEADLYGIEIGLPATNMIEALESIAVATGNSHERPSWHHDSLGNRIRFIQKADADHTVMLKLKRKAALSLFAYTVCLFGGIFLLAL